MQDWGWIGWHLTCETGDLCGLGKSGWTYGESVAQQDPNSSWSRMSSLDTISHHSSQSIPGRREGGMCLAQRIMDCLIEMHFIFVVMFWLVMFGWSQMWWLYLYIGLLLEQFAVELPCDFSWVIFGMFALNCWKVCSC
jgi:hypothetical protein